MLAILGKQWLCFGTAVLIAAMVWAVPDSLQASVLLPDEIVLPDQAPLNGGQLRAQFDVGLVSSLVGLSAGWAFTNGQTAGSSSGHLLLSPERPAETIFAQLQLASSGATTGASTSMSGPGGCNAHPIDSVAAVSLFDAELVAWIGGERHCTLPMPPSNDLLRPPQEF